MCRQCCIMWEQCWMASPASWSPLLPQLSVLPGSLLMRESPPPASVRCWTMLARVSASSWPASWWRSRSLTTTTPAATSEQVTQHQSMLAVTPWLSWGLILNTISSLSSSPPSSSSSPPSSTSPVNPPHHPAEAPEKRDLTLFRELWSWWGTQHHGCLPLSGQYHRLSGTTGVPWWSWVWPGIN